MGNSCFQKRHGKENTVRLAANSVKSVINEENLPEAFSQGNQIRWKLGDLIAEGKFCKVYQSINMKTGELLVIKSYPTTRSSSNIIQELKKIRRESEILKELDHKNIIKLFQIETSCESVDLVMECIPGGCLEEILKKYGSLEEEIVKNYLKQLCEVLVYLQEKGITHNNLQIQNIYITSTGTVKLSGFKIFTRNTEVQNLQAFKLTDIHPHSAPEVLQGNKSGNSDVWSLGLLAINMISGCSPIESLGKDSSQLIKLISSKNFRVPLPKCSLKFNSFLSACLVQDPSERSTVQDLLRHEFITGTKFSYDYGDESVKASLSRTADCHNAIPEADSE